MNFLGQLSILIAVAIVMVLFMNGMLLVLKAIDKVRSWVYMVVLLTLCLAYSYERIIKEL